MFRLPDRQPSVGEQVDTKPSFGIAPRPRLYGVRALILAIAARVGNALICDEPETAYRSETVHFSHPDRDSSNIIIFPSRPQTLTDKE